MDATRLPNSVQRIIVLRPGVSGAVVPTTIFEKSSEDPCRKKKKKKGSLLLRPFERTARYMADAAATSATVYAQRHRESNLKRKDGWIRDINSNLMRAVEKGNKRVKFTRLLVPF